MSETNESGQAPEFEDVEILPEGQVEEQRQPEQERRQQPKKPKFSGIEDEDADLSARVQKRMAVYTRKSYEAQAERDRERAARIAAERQLAEFRKNSLAGTDESLEREFKAAQLRQQRAFADADGEAVAATSAELAQIAARRVDVQRQAEQIRVPQQEQPVARATPQTQAYIDANPWFETDMEARNLALISDRQAIAKGLRPDTPEYFEFVTKRVKAVFPEHFEDEEPDEEPQPQQRRAAPPAPAAAARRSVPGQQPSRPKLPSLTAEEAAMAKRMNISPNEYAAEKARIMASENNRCPTLVLPARSKAAQPQPARYLTARFAVG